MTDVSPKRTIYANDLIDLKLVVVPTSGAEIGFDPLPGNEAAVETIMLAPHNHFTCWKRGNIPPKLHYGTNRRVPAIFCLAEPGWTVTTRAEAARYPPLLGNHGYDPALPDMAALFVAHGPSFRSGVTAPDFDNVDIYSLLTRVMGLTPLANDGSLAPLKSALVVGR